MTDKLPGESGNGTQNGLDINFRTLSRKYHFYNDVRVRTKLILEAVKAEVERQSRVGGDCRKLVGPLHDVEGGKLKAGVCHTGDWKVAGCNIPGGKEQRGMGLGLPKEQ